MKRIIFAVFLFIIFVFFYVFEEPSHSSFGAQQENIFGQNQYDCTHTTSNSSPDQWAKTYGGTGDDLGKWIIEKTDGSGYIVGYLTCTFDAGGTEHGDIWILDLSPSGDIEWQKTYGGTGEEKLYGGIQETNDGGYIAAGLTRSYGAGRHDFWILKLTASGDIEWQRTYGGSDMDFPLSIQVTSDGGYIVAGTTYSFGAGEEDFWILKLTSSGDIEWQRTYGGSSGDRASSIQPTEDGGYIVIGRTGSFGAGKTDFWILKLSSSGDIEWQRTYGGSGSDWPVSHFLQTSDGGYIVSGTTESFGAGPGDLWILKFTSNWDIEWQRTYGGSGYEEAASVKETIDGGYIVKGITDSFGAGGNDGWILKLTSSGDIEWQRTYGGSGDWDGIWSIRVTSDGGYIVSGNTDSFGAGGDDLWVLKLSPNGDIPCCAIMGISDALVSDTSVSPVDTHVIPMDTNVIPQNTDILPGESDAVVHNLCPGPYTLILSVTAGGTTNPEPGTYTYDDGGTEVEIEAIPNSGYYLSNWSGDASGRINPITIAMDSDKSITASFTAVSTGDGDGDGKKGGCFIATVAYGSPIHPHLDTLRDFRDTYLMPNEVGRVLVDLYYKYAPSVADLIAKHKVLKIAVRINLLPLVAFSYSMLHFGPTITAFMLAFVFALPIFFIWLYRRKMRRVEAKDLKALASR